ncbi:hypothetical protein GV368_01360 [Tepidiphilus sp. B18-69]|uniref:Uncharacterized protein n=1 Tax=Tepidiphilus baoligensis TaxID=2698687 RepID=A0ABX1QKP5_9PROT|nr:hypothetical protein [Tepidiphilus baoligensis]
MPEDIRARILAVQEKTGFIPNVFLALAHRPEEFRAFFAYHDALMEKYSMSNRIANMSALRPNDEFYAMGRT